MGPTDLEKLALISFGLNPDQIEQCFSSRIERRLKDGKSVVFFSDLKIEQGMNDADHINLFIGDKNFVCRLVDKNLYFNELVGKGIDELTRLSYGMEKRDISSGSEYWDICLRGSPYSVQIKSLPREGVRPSISSPDYLVSSEVHKRFFQQYASMNGLDIKESNVEGRQCIQTFALPSGKSFKLSRKIETDNLIHPCILDISFDPDKNLDSLLEKRKVFGLHRQESGKYQILTSNKHFIDLQDVTNTIKEYYLKK
jgi:hypothetical protein